MNDVDPSADGPQPTASTEALLEQGAKQLARSRRLLDEIDAMVRPDALWPDPEARRVGDTES